jgi:uncharacterized protein YuzE
MKLHYYPETDTLYIQLKNEPSTESEEIAHDVVIDFNADGKIVGIDIDHASQAVDLSELAIEALPKTLERPTEEAAGRTTGYYTESKGPKMTRLAAQILQDATSTEAARALAASVLSQRGSTKAHDASSRRDT